MNKPVVFLHIPKTAGQSIDAVLKEEFPDDKYHYLHGKNLVEYNIEVIKQGFTFCFIRNPWDRMVSNYFYSHKMYGVFGRNRNSPLHNLRINIAEKTNSFEEFVYWIYKYQGNDLKQFHFIPQSHFIEPIRKHINFIGRYESLTNDIKKLSKFLNISISLPIINKSDGREEDYTTYYNGKTRKMVKELYEDDIKNFKYKFGE